MAAFLVQKGTMLMLPNRYSFRDSEPKLAQFWSEQNIYQFDADGSGPIFTIDTPPTTVSGELHIGHVYSYTQTDVIARYRRMRGERVLYPMGFDDNGLPTERFAEKTMGRKATTMDLHEFIDYCLELTRQTENRFESIWRRLGLSVDWYYRYSTLSPQAQRVSQWSFIELYKSGRAYAQPAPTLWCPECQTAIAQAEVDDTTLPTLFSTIAFVLENGEKFPIATTRPELLPACVAIFIHPDDARYKHLIGTTASIESGAFSTQAQITVPILTDELVDPTKGTGAVMCCTFGDSTDIRWWRTHGLPLRQAIGRDGRMISLAGPLAGLTTLEARKHILQELAETNRILHQESIEHTIGTHERCGTPVEYLHTRQWFIRVLDQKQRLIEAGRAITWQPEHMRIRYEHWVENLQWDWCISRQRFLGVPFPAWTCKACGELLLATLEQLPVDPRRISPAQPCPNCGATDFEPEPDVMDTWATSSCTPLIIAHWPDDTNWFAQHFPTSLRPQGHDIIRTWAFYSIVKSLYHTGEIPWHTIMISGHALSTGRNKISKSRGHNEAGPMELTERESADALRYWATSVKTGNDTPFHPETIANGRRLVTKLWNASRFAEGRLADFTPQSDLLLTELQPTDRWLLSRLARTVVFATQELEQGEYASARAEIEHFFWSDLCDNYLELAKARLYQESGSEREAAQWTLYHALLTVLKLFASYLPYITEEIYQGLFRERESSPSIHLSSWPQVHNEWIDEEAEEFGKTLLELLKQVRRYKAEHGLSVGAELETLQISMKSAQWASLEATLVDLKSATRAKVITLRENSLDTTSKMEMVVIKN